MKEEDLDIVDLIIQNIPQDTEVQARIKMYMESHKSNCNNFIYAKYQKEATFFNTILKSLACDLSCEILRNFQEQNLI